jgi:hypothetical protein
MLIMCLSEETERRREGSCVRKKEGKGAGGGGKKYNLDSLAGHGIMDALIISINNLEVGFHIAMHVE